MFSHTSPCERTILLLYVDDMIVTGDDIVILQCTETLLHQQFEMKNLRLLHYFLGIEVTYGHRDYLLS